MTWRNDPRIGAYFPPHMDWGFILPPPPQLLPYSYHARVSPSKNSTRTPSMPCRKMQVGATHRTSCPIRSLDREAQIMRDQERAVQTATGPGLATGELDGVNTPTFRNEDVEIPLPHFGKDDDQFSAQARDDLYNSDEGDTPLDTSNRRQSQSPHRMEPHSSSNQGISPPGTNQGISPPGTNQGISPPGTKTPGCQRLAHFPWRPSDEVWLYVQQVPS